MRGRSLYHLRAALLMTAALVIGLLTESCSTSSLSSPTIVPEIEIRGSDPVESVGLSQGKILAIDLATEPSNGYTWKVGFVDRSILEPMAGDSLAPDSTGMTILRFKAVGKGESELKLLYGRTFEKDEPLGRVFSVRVTVQ